MNGVDVLDRLHRAGLQAWRGQDGRILVSPHHRLAPELADLVREHRAAVLDALPTEGQADRIRQYAAGLGAGGPEWGERLIRFISCEQAAEVLAWLSRRAEHGQAREAAR